MIVARSDVLHEVSQCTSLICLQLTCSLLLQHRASCGMLLHPGVSLHSHTAFYACHLLSTHPRSAAGPREAHLELCRSTMQEREP